MNGSTERKPEKTTFFLRYLAHSVLKFQCSSFALWDHKRFSSSTTLGFLAASPANTTRHSHSLGPRRRFVWVCNRFQNPSVAALATNRFGRDIPGTNGSDFVSFCSLSKKGQDLKGLKKSQESQNAVNCCKSCTSHANVRPGFEPCWAVGDKELFASLHWPGFDCGISYHAMNLNGFGCSFQKQNKNRSPRILKQVSRWHVDTGFLSPLPQGPETAN